MLKVRVVLYEHVNEFYNLAETHEFPSPDDHLLFWRKEDSSRFVEEYKGVPSGADQWPLVVMAVNRIWFEHNWYFRAFVQKDEVAGAEKRFFSKEDRKRIINGVYGIKTYDAETDDFSAPRARSAMGTPPLHTDPPSRVVPFVIDRRD